MMINVKIDDLTVSPQNPGMDRKGVPDSAPEEDPKSFERILAKNEQMNEGVEKKSKPESKADSLPDTEESIEKCGAGLGQIGPVLQAPLSQSQIQIPDAVVNEDVPLLLPAIEKEPVDILEVALTLGLPQLQMFTPNLSSKPAPEAAKPASADKSVVILNSLAKDGLTDQDQMLLQRNPKEIDLKLPLNDQSVVQELVVKAPAEIKTQHESGKSESSKKPKSLEEIFFAGSRGSNANDKAIPESSSKSQMDLGSEDKPETLKDFASSLFVQNQLKSSGESNFASQIARQITVSEKPNSDLVRSNLFQDMKVHLEKMVAADRGGEVRIHMNPGDLGAVKIDVKVMGEAVRIDMTAEKSSAESLLKSQVGELRNQLQTAGFKIEELQISSSRSAQQDKQFSQSERGFSQQQHEPKQRPEAEPESNFDDQFVGAA